MTYPGGKSGEGVYQTIINQIPPHDRYIEPFLGGGGIMRHKRPALTSIGIDADAGVVARWQAGEFGFVPHLQVFCGDGIVYLHGQKNLSPHDFVYCDPPYLFNTRSSGPEQLYLHELGTEDEHTRLLTVLLTVPCMVAISGYASSLYLSLLRDWRMITFPAVTRAGRVAEECLWMNYPQPTALHDYRYVGSNYRERENFKRKQKRWRDRIARMNAVERRALLAAMQESETT